MAYWYYDAATGSDANDGTTWAQAEATIEAVLADASAGDTIFARANASETTADTNAGTRTLTSGGTIGFPVRVVGVKAGTTNTGASVVAADLAVKSGDQPVIEVTGAGNDINPSADYTEWSYIKLDCPDRFNFTGGKHIFHQCDIGCDNMLVNNASTWHDFYDCDILIGKDGDTGSGFNNTDEANFRIFGGSLTSSIAHNYLKSSGGCSVLPIIGCDCSGLNLSSGYANTSGTLKMINCRIDASPTLFAGTPSAPGNSIEMIGCDNSTSITNTNSIQVYKYEDAFGTVDTDETIVRTGGADDGASGSFSYKVTPRANNVLEGSLGAIIWTPWMSVWVDGGSSTTLTVYTTTDGSADYTEEEMLFQVFTPDAGDTATHDMNFDPPALDFFSESTTAITDDASSTWVTHNTFKQSMSATVTPGYTGFAYGRVGVCKRQATPDSVWVDPKIVVT